jgi:hypothetical protein
MLLNDQIFSKIRKTKKGSFKFSLF